MAHPNKDIAMHFTGCYNTNFVQNPQVYNKWTGCYILGLSGCIASTAELLLEEMQWMARFQTAKRV